MCFIKGSPYPSEHGNAHVFRVTLGASSAGVFLSSSVSISVMQCSDFVNGHADGFVHISSMPHSFLSFLSLCSFLRCLCRHCSECELSSLHCYRICPLYSTKNQIWQRRGGWLFFCGIPAMNSGSCNSLFGCMYILYIFHMNCHNLI